MAVKKSGLGKSNLKVLFSASTLQNVSKKKEEKADVPAVESHEAVSKLPVDKIVRGQYQPRQHFDQVALQELADSIKVQGIIQPIVVRPITNQKYEIIAGERRWRAAQLAQLQDVPVIIRELDDESAIAVALIENIQREDLNPIEEAQSLQRLLDEFALTHEEVAEAVGKSRTTITNLLRLLALNPDVKDLLANHKIEVGHAKVLLSLQGTLQSQIAKTVALKGLTVRETEQLVKGLQNNHSKSTAKEPVDPNIRQLEQDLMERLKARISLQHQKGGKGKIIISYNSMDELDGILQHIQ